MIDEKGSVVMLIALLIIRLGAKNVWTPILILLDANLDPELRAEIEEKFQPLTASRVWGMSRYVSPDPIKW